MGFYINPPEGTKEQWLEKHGEQTRGPAGSHRSGTAVLVCLVDNGAFAAAAICYSKRELEAFTYASDMRPKQWFWVEEQKLAPFMHGQEIEQ